MAQDDDYIHTITLSQGDLSRVVSALYFLGLRQGQSQYTETANRVCVQVEQSMLLQAVAEADMLQQVVTELLGGP